MSKKDLVPSFGEFINEDHKTDVEIDGDVRDEATEFGIDYEILDELVELVGDEETVETAAKLAYEDLVSKALDTMEDSDDEPECLAFAALVVKLAEMEKLSAEDADAFLEKHMGKLKTGKPVKK